MTEYYQVVTLTLRSGAKCVYTGPVQMAEGDFVTEVHATGPLPLKEGMSFESVKDIHDFDKHGDR